MVGSVAVAPREYFNCTLKRDHIHHNETLQGFLLSFVLFSLTLQGVDSCPVPGRQQHKPVVDCDKRTGLGRGFQRMVETFECFILNDGAYVSVQSGRNQSHLNNLVLRVDELDMWNSYVNWITLRLQGVARTHTHK